MGTGCRNPFIKDGLAFPCGQCEPCLYLRRQVWTYRLQLEAMCHEASAFVTLTYSDAELVRTASSVPTLCPEHAQAWLKRLRERERSEGRFFRFYLVGEYGDKTHRPHYHCVLFGFKPCIYGRTRRDPINDQCRRDCCVQCRLIYDTWSRGIIEVGEVNKDSCGYIAGYVMKKMTRFDDPRLNGRNPEFCRMSNRGGLGVGRVENISRSLLHFGLDGELLVPVCLNVGSSRQPLGRYLVRKLRKSLGYDEKAPQAILDALAAELLPLREAAFNASSSFKKAIVAEGDGRYANFMARNELYRRRRGL